MISFASYADEALATLPANNTNFDVTIPTDLGALCTVAGDCVGVFHPQAKINADKCKVLQWFWFGTGAKQTYESCVDFVVPASDPATSGAVTAVTNSSVSSGAGVAVPSASVQACKRGSASRFRA